MEKEQECLQGNVEAGTNSRWSTLNEKAGQWAPSRDPRQQGRVKEVESTQRRQPECAFYTCRHFRKNRTGRGSIRKKKRKHIGARNAADGMHISAIGANTRWCSLTSFHRHGTFTRLVLRKPTKQWLWVAVGLSPIWF